MNSTKPVIVYGEGSAAVFLISQLLKKGESVVWAAGSGAKIIPVMPYLKSDLAFGALLDCNRMGQDEILENSAEVGVFHRVFRNKGFKLPTWKKTTQVANQQQNFEAAVWGPEQAFLGIHEVRMTNLTPASVEQSLRDAFETHPNIKRVPMVPVSEFEVFEQGGKIQFANGFITEFSQFYFCDSLTELKSIPKLSTILKHQVGNVKLANCMSVLQVVFHHSVPLQQTFETGLVIPMNRDSGETFDRDVLGYFMEPNKSVWTVFLQPSEIEENHEIMKKLRRMKQALNKAFDQPEFLPVGHKEFMSTVEKEQVRFEENHIAVHGGFKESKSNDDFILLTDSFGISACLEHMAKRFEIEAVQFIETDSIDDSISEVLHEVIAAQESEINLNSMM